MSNYDPELQTHFRLWLDGEEVPFPEGSARFVQGSIEPIDQAVYTRRTVNGNLRVQADPAFRKFRLTVSCTDSMLPALFGIDPTAVATVWSPVVVRERGTTPSRTPVSGSLVAEDDWIEYRPILTGYLTSIPSLSEPEWQSDASWSLVFEESAVPTAYFVTLSDADLVTVAPGGSLSFNVAVLAATNTGLPITFARVGGSFPPGVSLNPSTGMITGTPTGAGLYTFTIRAASGGQTGEQTYSILVNAASAPRVLFAAVVQQDYEPGVSFGLNLAASVEVDNSSAVPVFAVVGGSLPPGLSLSTSGAVFGTPTGYGPYAAQVRAIISTGEFAIQTVAFDAAEPSVVFGPVAAQTHVPGTAFSLDLAPSVSVENTSFEPQFEVVSGSLPAGLSLSSAGVISGTPTAAGSFSVVVRAFVPDASDEQRVAFYAALPTIASTGVAMQNYTVGSAFSFDLATLVTVTGTAAAPTFTADVGSLPAGLSMSSAGVISGTPTAYGAYAFTARATMPTGQWSEVTVALFQQNPDELPDAVILGGTAQTWKESIAESSTTYDACDFTSSAVLTVLQAGWTEYVLVGGGGGGASVSSTSGGGGGGAGHFRRERIYLPVGTYTVTIGGGGGPGFAGSQTSFSSGVPLNITRTASGGGRGGTTSQAGASGASGGGGGGSPTAGGAGGTATSVEQGSNGAAGNTNATAASQNGGGGGGYSEVGLPGSNGRGHGGGGIKVSLWTALNFCAGGGGGAGNGGSNNGAGGSSIGGNGGASNAAGASGAANSGAGGGGAGGGPSGSRNGGAGGSGRAIFIVKRRTA